MGLNIVEFVKSLIPHIEKDQVVEDLRITESELDSIVLPSYSSASVFFSKDKFKSKENEKINDRVLSYLKSNSRFGRQTTFIGEFDVRLQNVRKNLAILIKHIDREIGRDVVTDGISSKKAVLIRIAEKFSYISRYSLDILNLVYLNEASEYETDTREISMSPAEIAKARGSIDNVAKLIAGYGIEPKDFEKQLESTPDVILNRTDNKDVESIYTDKEIDPLTSPLVVGFAGSPIYHIRLLVAEWQVKRYKANQEKKKVLELRLLHLQLLKDRQGTNPKLEKEIAYNQQRVAKLDRYLKEVEEDLEIAA